MNAVNAVGNSPTAVAQYPENIRAPMPEQLAEILRRLREPFDPAIISWVIKARRPGKNCKQGLVLPYADPRAYTDRLDELFTPIGWTRDYTVEVVEGIDRRKKGSDHSTIGAMVLVVCRLSIGVLGHTHSGTGEGWADDDNVLTSADARAFKRACSCFGLGRYLYDVPGNWVNLDEYERPVSYPNLPLWALPGHGNGTSGKRSRTQVSTSNGGGKTPKTGAGSAGLGRNAGSKSAQTQAGVARPENNGHLPAEALIQEIRDLEGSVGSKLFAGIVQGTSGVNDMAKVRDAGMLAAIRERLANANRGVQRLKTALDSAGLAGYAKVCQDLGFSGGIGDIPDLKILRALMERMEAVAKQTSAEPRHGSNDDGVETARRPDPARRTRQR